MSQNRDKPAPAARKPMLSRPVGTFLWRCNTASNSVHHVDLNVHHDVDRAPSNRIFDHLPFIRLEDFFRLNMSTDPSTIGNGSATSCLMFRVDASNGVTPQCGDSTRCGELRGAHDRSLPAPMRGPHSKKYNDFATQLRTNDSGQRRRDHVTCKAADCR